MQYLEEVQKKFEEYPSQVIRFELLLEDHILFMTKDEIEKTIDKLVLDNQLVAVEKEDIRGKDLKLIDILRTRQSMMEREESIIDKINKQNIKAIMITKSRTGQYELYTKYILYCREKDYLKLKLLI